MSCPRCRTYLIPAGANPNRLECPRCRGVACNRTDLALLVGSGRRAQLRTAFADGDPTGMPCPTCRSVLHRITVGARAGELTIEGCRDCETVWLDHGEIVHLTGAVIGERASGIGHPAPVTPGRRPNRRLRTWGDVVEALADLLGP